jgi:AraC family transcriptional regulator of adaptative response/methylated-DNA-[protein]-cysteine methyltransferase
MRRVRMTLADAWINGGAGVTIRWTKFDTLMGNALIAATERGICRLSFDEDVQALMQRFPRANIVKDDAALAPFVAATLQAIECPSDPIDVPLDVGGTAFQQSVWAELRRIPAGETRSYADIARAVGSPNAVRAAGAANGANRVAIIIPCHRVIRSGGKLGGYAYGLERKSMLLARESRQANLFAA